MVKRKGINKQKKKNDHLWEILDDIRWNKTGKLLDNEEYVKKFSPYLVLKILSMDRNNLNVVNLINQYQSDPNIDNKMIYSILVDLVPKSKGFTKYIKHEKVKNENLKVIMDYFECSRKDAELYLDMRGENWVKEIASEYGGKR